MHTVTYMQCLSCLLEALDDMKLSCFVLLVACRSQRGAQYASAAIFTTEKPLNILYLLIINVAQSLCIHIRCTHTWIDSLHLLCCKNLAQTEYLQSVEMRHRDTNSDSDAHNKTCMTMWRFYRLCTH